MPGTWSDQGGSMLEAVAAAVEEQGAKAWLVGGSVRDRELGRFSPDIDVTVTGDAEGIARAAARLLGVPWFTLSDEHLAFRVVGQHACVDVAAVRGGDILSDLHQRDFTINAMARPLHAGGSLGALIDPSAGLADLAARRLRAVSDRIFLDDPLRLMRAVRFAHVLDLELEPGLRRAIEKQAEKVKQAAPERIAAEMILTLDAGGSGAAVRLWTALGLLAAVVPEALITPNEDGPSALLDRLEDLLAHRTRLFPDVADRLEVRLSDPVDGAIGRPAALRLAGLLKSVAPLAAPKVARRLRLSSRMESLVDSALRAGAWTGLPVVTGSAGRPGRDAILFMWATAPWEPENILLASAACPGAAGPAAALMTLWARRSAAADPGLPLDGNGLMAELGLAPGPRLGKALRAARLAWEAGEASTREEALAAARAALDDGPAAFGEGG